MADTLALDRDPIVSPLMDMVIPTVITVAKVVPSSAILRFNEDTVPTMPVSLVEDEMTIRLAKAPSAYGRLPTVAGTKASSGRDQADSERRPT